MAKRQFVTKKKISGGRKEFRPWKEWKAGDFVIGEYIGEHEDGYQNICRVVKVVEANFQGKPKSSKAIVDKNLVLNSAGMLDKAFDENEIEFGQIVKVTYNGTNEIEKGKYKGKESHTFDIELLEDEDEPSEDDIEDEDESDDDDEEGL